MTFSPSRARQEADAPFRFLTGAARTRNESSVPARLTTEPAFPRNLRRRPVGRPLAPSSPRRPNDALAAGIARSSAGFSNRPFTRLTESGTHYRMSSGRIEKPASGLEGTTRWAHEN